MKNLLIIALLLCGSMSATGQRVRDDSLLITAIQEAVAKTNAQYADQIARLTDCSNMVEVAEKIYDKPRIIYIPKRYMVKRGYPVRIVIIAHYDPQTNASHYQLKRIKYTKRQYQ